MAIIWGGDERPKRGGLVQNWLDPEVEAHPSVQMLGLVWTVVIAAYAIVGWLVTP
jgi:hypothetical protein